MLSINNLYAEIGEELVLKGLSLVVKEGESHAIMGPNGSGKSTTAKIISGFSGYSVVSGSIEFKDEDILALEPEERANKGIFVGFQYPPEIAGVPNEMFLFESVNSSRAAKGLDLLSKSDFQVLLDENMKLLNMKEEFLKRSVNEGFSGGEKKRNEILQLLILDPQIAILDETDSGLDVDSMKLVAFGINEWKKRGNKSLILITHYRRILDLIPVEFVHILHDGKIKLSGGFDLVNEIEHSGYDNLINTDQIKGA